VRKRLYIISLMILLIGSGSAVLLYQNALHEASDESRYEIIGGFVYPAHGENSKKYVHDLQLYGGQTSMLADEFMRWFAGLWHGKMLAYTTACIAFVLSFVLYVIANNLPDGVNSHERK
jgi:hypothetical protein